MGAHLKTISSQKFVTIKSLSVVPNTLKVSKSLIKNWVKESSRILLTPQEATGVNLHIRVCSFGRERLKGFVFCSKKNHYMVVIITRTHSTRKELLSTLMHEMIHLKQFVKGELILYDKKGIWKGRKVKFTDATYNSTPWEREAYGNEHSLFRKVERRRRYRNKKKIFVTTRRLLKR